MIIVKDNSIYTNLIVNELYKICILKSFQLILGIKLILISLVFKLPYRFSVGFLGAARKSSRAFINQDLLRVYRNLLIFWKRNGLKIEQSVAEIQKQHTKRKYKEIVVRFKLVAEYYLNRTTLDHLRGIAHNLNIHI